MRDSHTSPSLADALMSLDERHRRVIELRHGMRGQRAHTLAEVGRLLKLSTQRVQELERGALARLDAGHGIALRARANPEGSGRLLQGLMRPWTLMLLWDQPAHGYELVDRLAEAGLCVDTGAIYRLLRRLEREGHVRTLGWQPSNHGPARRVYALTPQGIAHLHDDARTLTDLEGLVSEFTSRHAARSHLERDRGQRTGAPEPG